MVFQGGNAIGSGVLGAVAEHVGLSPTLLIATVGLGLGPLLGLRYRFRTIAPRELLPAGDWPAPHVIEPDGHVGPVMVTVEYRPREGRHDELLAALREARFSRRRTGAIRWRVWRDAADPNRIIEQFVVASWQEHLRQGERVTERDQKRLDTIRALTEPEHPVSTTHWLSP